MGKREEAITKKRRLILSICGVATSLIVVILLLGNDGHQQISQQVLDGSTKSPGDVGEEKGSASLFTTKRVEIANLRMRLQHLKSLEHTEYGGRTLTLENELVFQDYEPSDSHAIVTMVGFPTTGHPYWMGGLALMQSLRETMTRVPHLVVMVANTISIPGFVIELYENLGVELIYIENIDMDDFDGVYIPGIWKHAFDKLNVWKLTQFDKVLFLDSDTLFVQNIDHFLMFDEFTAPVTPIGCTRCNVNYLKEPEFHTLSSGFFICKPSLSTFERMMDLLSKPSPDPKDIEQHNGTWHWGDQEMIRVVFDQLDNNWNKMKWNYDNPVGHCGCMQKRTVPMYSYHFVCTYPLSKPWYAPFGNLYREEYLFHPCFLELYNLWFRIFAKSINKNNSDIIPDTHILEEFDWKAEDYATELGYHPEPYSPVNWGPNTFDQLNF